MSFQTLLENKLVNIMLIIYVQFVRSMYTEIHFIAGVVIIKLSEIYILSKLMYKLYALLKY